MLVLHVDILPTVLDVAGVAADGYAGPGSSILARIRKAPPAETIYSFSEADGRCRARRAVVDGRYKYIYTPDRPLDRALLESERFFDGVCAGQAACASVPREELYDLREDPAEHRNIIHEADSRSSAANLRAIARARARSDR